MNRGLLLRCETCWSFGAMRINRIEQLPDAVVVELECVVCVGDSKRIVGVRGETAKAFVLAAAQQGQEVASS